MYEYQCRIVKVIDGDTIKIDIDLGFGIWMTNQNVRLAGVDAPEYRTTDQVEKKYGTAAKEFVESYLKVGDIVPIKTTLDKKSKYGNILAEFKVYDSEKDILHSLNQLMIEKYHAVSYFGESKEELRPEHLKNREMLDL